MVSGNVNVNVNDRTEQLLMGLSSLSKVDVLVGIPEENSSREGERITNAELAFIHTNGSPIQGIPARPIIEPAISDSENKEQIMVEIERAAEAGMDGNIEALSRYLNQAGMVAAEAVKMWFTNPKNGWVPDSPLTIKRKGSDKPLINIGELRKSMSYVIREKD